MLAGEKCKDLFACTLAPDKSEALFLGLTACGDAKTGLAYYVRLLGEAATVA